MRGPWTDDLELALSAAHEAGEAVMRSFRSGVEVRQKSPGQPVTPADLQADRILAERLREGRSDYGWLSEETAARPGPERGRVWVVDPIDGTRSFIAGYREFGVSVALAEDGEAVVGVIYNPARREVFWAVREGGSYRARAWTGGVVCGERLRMKAPAAGERRVLLASRSEISRKELAPLAGGWSIRPLGSTAYKLACLASGVGHGYASRGPKFEWDVAAGALIVEEAGGRVTDLRGESLRYNRPDPAVSGVVAASTPFHGPLLERTRREGWNPYGGAAGTNADGNRSRRDGCT